MSEFHSTPASAAKLAAMANQIALFFKPYPHDRAIAGISIHIGKFWTPKMRDLLTDHARNGDPALDALVVAAMLEPTASRSPTENDALGDLAHCDAG